MALKTLLVPLFATVALTAPSSPAVRGVAKSAIVKRYAPGWCTLHIHSDWSNQLDANPTHKVEIKFCDAAREDLSPTPV